MPFIFILFLYSTSVLFTLFLGLLVFLKDWRAKAHRFYFFFVLSTIGWLVSLFIFHYAESQKVVLWFGRANYATVLLLLYFLLEFAIIFPQENIPVPRRFRRALLVWTIGFFFITLFTSLVDKAEIIAGPLMRQTVYGPLYFPYVANYVILGGGALFSIFYKLKNTKERLERYQLIYFVAGLTFALAFGFITNIVLYYFGFESMANYGVLAPVFFVGFTAYAIFKYHLFNIKIILVELLVVTTGFTLISQVFFVETTFLRTINGILFLLFSVFGFLLIQNVRREVHLREQLVVANAELKKLNEIKTEFLSIASHQMQAPLTATKASLSMMQEGDFGAVSDEQKDVIKKIMQSEEHLIDLVGNFLDFSRIETNRVQLTLSSVDIGKLITMVIDELRPLAINKKLDLTLSLPSEPIISSVDSEKIHQAFLNIIENAIKYTERGAVAVTLVRQLPNFVVSVRDTGRGITDEEKKSIFQKFTRGKQAAKGSRGTGLGLYIANEFVTLHGGRITVESEGLGKGSTFIVTLPAEISR